MRSLLDRLGQLARSDMSILLTGENGTGKSLLAAYLHRRSARAQQSFIAVNMSAVTESLFESEMFGHVKGAFCATRTRAASAASTSAIFLDEIGNTCPSCSRASAARDRRTRVRAPSARIAHAAGRRAHRLDQRRSRSRSRRGRFRQDLFYRLNTVALRAPLRERDADIAPLAARFLRATRANTRAIPRLSIRAAGAAAARLARQRARSVI